MTGYSPQSTKHTGFSSKRRAELTIFVYACVASDMKRLPNSLYLMQEVILRLGTRA